MGKKVQPGEQHNSLTALHRVEGSVWLWECVCGEEVEAVSYYVRSGSRQSCGCVRNAKLTTINKQKSKPMYESCKNVVFLRYKAQAKKRNLDFNLDREFVDHVTQQLCHYCGAAPSNSATVRWNSDVWLYNGIDRIDNNGDYTTNNVVPCCKLCNQAKNNLTHDEFLQLVDRIHNHCRLTNIDV